MLSFIMNLVMVPFKIAFGAVIGILQILIKFLIAGMSLIGKFFVAVAVLAVIDKRLDFMLISLVIAGLCGKHGLPVLLVYLYTWLEGVANKMYYTTTYDMEDEMNYD